MPSLPTCAFILPWQREPERFEYNAIGVKQQLTAQHHDLLPMPWLHSVSGSIDCLGLCRIDKNTNDASCEPGFRMMHPSGGDDQAVTEHMSVICQQGEFENQPQSPRL